MYQLFIEKESTAYKNADKFLMVPDLLNYLLCGSISTDIVDGAHIKPFYKFKDDNYTNGLALCKNHHWAFDKGWFGIDDDYRIIIPPDRLIEEPPQESRSMKAFHNEPIFLPQKVDFCPDRKALTWHRQYWQIA